MAINKNFEELIKKYIADELTENEEKAFLAEAKGNRDAMDIVRMHQNLKSEKISFAMAENLAFKEMRLKTLNKVKIRNNQKLKSVISISMDYLIGLFKIPAFNLAFALSMFLFGFFISRPSTETELIESIYKTAAQSDDLQSSINAPYIYQNASFRELPNGKVTVNFDVSRHMEITRSRNDALIQDILAQSLLNSNSLPAKLRTISDTKITMHPKIKQALIETMLNDSHPIVRQKSLFSLMKYKNDKDIQDALIKLLSNEESVYMRLAAIDYLSNNDVDVSVLERSLNSMETNNNSAVEHKIRQLKY